MSYWFELPIDVAEFEEKLGVGAESGDYRIIEKVLPYADEVHEHTSVYQLNELDFMYRQLSSDMQEEYVSLLTVFENLEALYICRNKNFTAIDQHTTHEKEIIELRLQDTNGIENFVKNFAKSYYTWNNSKEAIESRTQAISGYLTKELQDLNVDTIRTDCFFASCSSRFHQHPCFLHCSSRPFCCFITSFKVWYDIPNTYFEKSSNCLSS